MFGRLVLLLLHLHELSRLLLLLKHQQLLLLRLVQHVDTAFIPSCCWYATREVSQLAQLVEVLGALQQYLLILCKVVVVVISSVLQDGHVLLQVSDLVVEIDELLGLLLDKEGSACDVEFHYGFLLVVNILEVLHLILCSLEAVVSLLLELYSVVGQGRRLLNSLSESHLLDGSFSLLAKYFSLLGELGSLHLSSDGDHGLMLLGSGWIDPLNVHEISVKRL